MFELKIRTSLQLYESLDSTSNCMAIFLLLDIMRKDLFDCDICTRVNSN